MDDDPRPQEEHGSFLQTLKAVSWGFLGVRRRQDQEKDAKGISPGYLIIVGLLLTLVFVLVLVTIARLFAANLT